MKIIKILKDGAEKIISILNIKKNTHKYKYCATVNIHRDVPVILKNRRIIENQSNKILQKLR